MADFHALAPFDPLSPLLPPQIVELSYNAKLVGYGDLPYAKNSVVGIEIFIKPNSLKKCLAACSHIIAYRT